MQSAGHPRPPGEYCAKRSCSISLPSPQLFWSTVFRSSNVLPGFFVGKFIGDAVVVFTGKVTAEKATDLMRGIISWQTALMGGIGLLVISGVLFIDWRQLLQRKKLRQNFAIWKT